MPPPTVAMAVGGEGLKHNELHNHYHRNGRKDKTPTQKERPQASRLVNLPAAHVEAMKWQNEKCGGKRSVSQQVRDAVRSVLCGCVYTELYKS